MNLIEVEIVCQEVETKGMNDLLSGQKVLCCIHYYVQGTGQ